MTPQPMTPEHPKWNEFVDQLEGPEGCDFQEIDGDIPEGYSRSGNITWRCAGGRDKSLATAILEAMNGTGAVPLEHWRRDIDVAASLAYFDEHGGHCDCEILFNVDP